MQLQILCIDKALASLVDDLDGGEERGDDTLEGLVWDVNLPRTGRIKQRQYRVRLKDRRHNIHHSFHLHEYMGDWLASVVVWISIDHLVNHFVRLGEKGYVEAFEHVIHKVVQNGDKEVFFFVVLDCIPDLDEFLFHEREVILTLYLQKIRDNDETYEFLDHKVCEWLLLVTIDVHEQERLDFFTQLIQR